MRTHSVRGACPRPEDPLRPMGEGLTGLLASFLRGKGAEGRARQRWAVEAESADMAEALLGMYHVGAAEPTWHQARHCSVHSGGSGARPVQLRRGENPGLGGHSRRSTRSMIILYCMYLNI